MQARIVMLILSIIYVSMTLVVYFSKQRINSVENQIYEKLISFVPVVLLMEIFSNLTAIWTPETLIAEIVVKFFFISILIWLTIFSLYVCSRTFLRKMPNIEFKKSKIKKIYFIVCLIFSLAILIFPFNFIMTDKGPYVDGIGAYTLAIAVFLLLITDIIAFVKHYKSLMPRERIPMFILLIIIGLIIVLKDITPELQIFATSFSFITVLMFFTIENPDVKMINELNMARDRADKANNAKTEFLSNMSHEIRTPLNAIVGFSNSLIDDSDDKEKIKDDAKYIVNASQNLLELVNGILDISKIEAGKIEIVNTEYDMKDALDNLVALSKARLGEKPIEFRTSFDESIPKYLYGDISRIKQICINLLTNSIKYTKEGFIEFKVSSVIKGDVCRLIISVEDSGIGIKNEDIDKLFEKFGRLDLEKNISIEGSGLGLAITKKLIEMMGGKIVVQSEYGIGSKFTISIDQKISNGTSQNNAPKDQINYQTEYPGKKVLVIDDNKLNLKVAEKVLQPFKVIITTASSGDEGIEKIINETFDLVLLDDMMPGKTGTDTLKELKENLADYKTPTVALTANAVVGMKEKYLAAGFDDYLAKPIEKEELKRILNKYLKN